MNYDYHIPYATRLLWALRDVFHFPYQASHKPQAFDASFQFKISNSDLDLGAQGQRYVVLGKRNYISYNPIILITINK